MYIQPLTRTDIDEEQRESVQFPFFQWKPRFTSDTPPPPPPSTFKVRSRERLYEKVTADGIGSSKVWKDFEHYKRTKFIPSSTTYHSTDTYSPLGGVASGLPYNTGVHKDSLFGFSGFGGFDQPFDGLAKLYQPEDTMGHFVPPPSGLDGLLQRALNSTMPKIKADLSLINSLIESKDLVHSLKRVRSVISAMRNKGLLNWTSSFMGGKPLRSLLRGAANVYLETQFNILPLLSDIAGLKLALADHEKRINDLVSRSGKPQIRHFQANLRESEEQYDESSTYSIDPNINQMMFPGVYGECQTFRRVVPRVSVFHVEIEYNYNFTQYDREHARLLSLLDRLGVNLNPAIIWNAIPWSFVVDWVAGIGPFLNQFTIHAMEPQINIRRALWSIRRDRQIVLTKTIGRNDIGLTYTEGGPACTIEESAYRRQTFVPGISSIQLSGLSLKEFSLGAALVFAKRRSPKRL
jgi:hypothetical protein